MKQLPAINDLVKLPQEKTPYLVRHVIPEQRKAKLVKILPNGQYFSFGYHDVESLAKYSKLGIA